MKNFEFFSMALDGSSDIVDTEQLLFYIRVSTDNNNFRVTEELLSVQSMKPKAKGVDIFQEFNKTHIDFSLPLQLTVPQLCLEELLVSREMLTTGLRALISQSFLGELFDTSGNSVYKES